MGIELMNYIPLLGVVGLVVMIAKAMWVSKQDAGDANMQELAGYIAKGASAFLKAEWKVLGVFAVIAAVLLAWSGTLVEHSDWVIAVAFLIGAALSVALVSSRAALTAAAPANLQSRVFAVHATTSDAIVVLPLLFAGVIAETLGARSTLAMLGALCGVTYGSPQRANAGFQ
jgi:K(+)-stimulated pyrophosphate-energized sodium pump